MAGLHGKKRMFVCVLVAGVLVLIAVWSIVYACTVTSVNISVSDESEEDAETNRSPSTIIPVGGTAFFYAECGYNENPNNDGIEWTFDLDGDGTYETTYPTEYDSQDEYLSTTQTHDYDDSGDYTISVKARLDDGEDTWQGPATCDVTVVGVEKVVKEGESNEVGPIFVCLNGEVDLEAIPDTGSTFPPGEPGWTYIQPTGASATLSTTSGVYTTIENMDKMGRYEVFAKSDHFESTGVLDDGDSIVIGVVVVEKVGSVGMGNEGPIYVCVNDDVFVQAEPEPEGAEWPDGEPTWAISGPEGASPSIHPIVSLAEATGLTVPGDYTVTATCGPDDTGDDLTVTAFEVVIDTPDPAIVTAGESLSVGCTPEPSGIEGGTYLWEKVTGPGTVTFSPSDEQNTSFSADLAGEYTVKVSYTVEGETASDTSDSIVVDTTCDIRKCAPYSGSVDLTPENCTSAN